MEKIQFAIFALFFFCTGVCFIRSSVHMSRLYKEWKKHYGKSDLNITGFDILRMIGDDLPDECKIHKKMWIRSRNQGFLFMAAGVIFLIITKIFQYISLMPALGV